MVFKCFIFFDEFTEPNHLGSISALHYELKRLQNFFSFVFNFFFFMMLHSKNVCFLSFLFNRQDSKHTFGFGSDIFL